MWWADPDEESQLGRASRNDRLESEDRPVEDPMAVLIGFPLPWARFFPWTLSLSLSLPLSPSLSLCLSLSIQIKVGPSTLQLEGGD